MEMPSTHPVLKRQNANIVQMDYESTPATTDVSQVEEQQENITFGDAEPAPPVIVPTMEDATRFDRDDGIAHLSGYLSRPVLINTFTWNTGATDVSTNLFYPWYEFFNDSHIKNKLHNFARLQCNLKLKFVINASPFYYGLLKVFYDPLVSDRFGGDYMPISQAPGAWITPQDTTSVEMNLPYFWPRDYLDVTSGVDFQRLGKIGFSIFSPLDSANAVSSAAITISCYAWAENVHLAGPTAQNAVQGPKGYVSRMSNNIATAARAISVIPPLATIGSTVAAGATMVSDLATALGFSNAPNMSDVSATQMKTFHAFANTEQAMPLDKLALDPENEVSLDATSAGLGSVDELAISEFCAHESYIASTDWVTTDVSTVPLMSYFVTPRWINSALIGSATHYTMTPSAFVARNFQYWRGSISYRIKIVASQYHKGRLQVSWDPQDDCSLSSDTETTCITKIVDLESEREIELLVPYKAVRAWQDVGNYETIKAPVKFGSGSYSWTPNKGQHNGCISIRVQNQLSAPVAPSTVRVFVFMKAGPDFEVAKPYDNAARMTVLPVQMQYAMDGKSVESEDVIPKFSVGERVASLRQLLHRTVHYTTAPRYIKDETPTTEQICFTTTCYPKFPQPFGFDAVTGINTCMSVTMPGTMRTGNLVHPLLIEQLANCFAGYRGSLNWHVNPLLVDGEAIPNYSVARNGYSQNLQASVADNAFAQNVSQLFKSPSNPSYVADWSTSTITAPVGKVWRRPAGFSGMTVTNSRMQPTVSVALPQYSQWRFQPSYALQRNKLGTDEIFDGFRVDYTHIIKSNDQESRYSDLFVSGGTDLNYFYFVCVPKMYLYALDAFTDH